MKGTVLLVDDEPYVRDSLAAVLRRREFLVRSASGSAEALDSGALAGVDAVVTDLRLAGEDGLALLRELARREPELPVVVLTAHGTVPSAVECIRAGAFDYLLKPADPEELMMILERALSESGMRRELQYLRARSGSGALAGRPLGVSEGWKQVLELAAVAAPFDTPVLLLGESGTGKEVAARHLHGKSKRSSGAYVTDN
jgi:DNA-binding NtrC family response regulator